LAEIYSAEYFLGEQAPEAEMRVAELKRATAGLYLDLLNSRYDVVGGDLLEIGSGRGELLVEAQARGFQVQGIEISPHATAAANLRLGAECVRVGGLETVVVAPASCDIVIFADVVEHVRDPLGFLRRVHDVLRPGGLAVLVTPSLDSWSARLLRRYWMEYKLEHLFYFNQGALRLAFEKTGFTEMTVVPNTKILSFDYVNHHFQRYPVPLISTLFGFGRNILPDKLAHTRIRLVASGTVAVARRRHSGTST
jgi:SAM-dependent methyltransferase